MFQHAPVRVGRGKAEGASTMTIGRWLFYAARMMDTVLRSLMELVHPIGLVWLGLWLLAVWLWVKRQRKAAVVSAFVAGFMSVVGSSRVPGDLLASLERPVVVGDLDELPVADAAVVLGGGARPSRHDVAGLDLNAAGDRLVMGLELVRREKAKHLVVGGAAHTVGGRELVEANLTKQWLMTWGLTNAPIVSLGACLNTRDEAVRVAELCRERGWQNVLLVTSAYHMKRAQATFRTAGVPVIGVPCDFQTGVSIETEPGIAWVPQHGGFQKLSLYLHEQIGWVVYRWRGWIKP